MWFATILLEAAPEGGGGIPEGPTQVVQTIFTREWLWGVTTTLLRVLLIIVVAWLLVRLSKRLIKRLINSMKEEGISKLGQMRSRAPLADTRPLNLARASMRTETIGGVLRSIATFTIWAIAALMVLGQIGIELGPLIAGAGIVGVALGFGAQRLVQDFLSGIFMLLEDQYGIGDYIDAGVSEGTVEGISLRTTRMRDVYGTVWHVPNGEIRRVGNFTQEWTRALLDIGIAYETDIDQAIRVIGRVASDMARDPRWSEQFRESPEVWGVQEFAESQITIRLVIKVIPQQQWAIQRELRRRIKYAFDAEGIEIPFPQRTVWTRAQEPLRGRNGQTLWEPTSPRPPAR